MSEHEVAVIGAGPNGLAAAIMMARAGSRVVVYEAAATAGGGCRTAEVTLPGFKHDICATAHPLAVVSRFFRTTALVDRISWVQPPIAVAHPLDGGEAAFIYPSLERTVTGLGQDGAAYRALFGPFVEAGISLLDDVLAPLHMPRHPVMLARFGASAIQPASRLAERHFKTEPTRALFAGMAAHSMLRMDQPLSAAAGLVLGTLAHLRGWPFAEGGSQTIINAMADELTALGGSIELSTPILDFAAFPSGTLVICDLAPRNVAMIAGKRFPDRFHAALRRYRHGPGAFKLDFAIEGAIPWVDARVGDAGTVHLGGTMAEIAAAEAAVLAGEHPARPFVLLCQPSQFDPSRAPQGKQTVWAYCHVPHGSERDMTNAIENQIERFAPGFRDRVIHKHAMSPADFEAYNANDIGGDIGGGVQDWRQLLTRPTLALHSYRTPDPDIVICSASTPPGGGVHGLGGYYAARDTLRIKRRMHDAR